MPLMTTATSHNLGASKAAAIVGCTAETIAKWAASGVIPAIRTPGGRWRFSQAELEAWLESRRVKAS